jgi:hypothetical protein
MMKFSPQKQKFIDSATEMCGAGSVLQKKDVVAASKSAGIPTAGWFLGQMKIGYNQQLEYQQILKRQQHLFFGVLIQHRTFQLQSQ